MESEPVRATEFKIQFPTLVTWEDGTQQQCLLLDLSAVDAQDQKTKVKYLLTPSMAEALSANLGTVLAQMRSAVRTDQRKH